MPLYEYRCTSCAYKFEKIQKFSDAPERECPKCQGELVRPVTAPALKFEGAGWYINDYAAKGGAPSSGTESAAEKSEGKSGEKNESKGADTGPAAAPAASGDASSTAKSAGPSASSSSTAAS